MARRRLIEISDELQAVDALDFEAKHLLNTEADDLRRRLASLTGDDTDARARWAERAGRKGQHTDSPEAARASIISPGEGGGPS